MNERNNHTFHKMKSTFPKLQNQSSVVIEFTSDTQAVWDFHVFILMSVCVFVRDAQAKQK